MIIFGSSKASKAAEQRKLVARLLVYLSEGKTDVEAQAELDVSPAKYANLRKALLESEADRLRETPTEHTYVEYCLAQTACIRDLTEIADEAKKQKNMNGLIGAVRARSDIIDKIIKKGQEFGVLEKKAEEKRIVAGIVVAQLSNVELKVAITSQIAELNKLVETYGEEDITQLALGPTHYALPEPQVIPAAGKTNRAKANPVHRGRRVVKQPAV